MSVRPGLLAILNEEPCHGYQLRGGFERRTGSARPLNVGQIYSTRDRSERDGLVVKADHAVTLPGVNIGRLIQAQRAATLRTPQELIRTRDAVGDPGSSTDLAET